MIKKESEILHCLAREPWKKFTFTELMKVSRKKSRSYLERVIKRFIKENILKQGYVGHLPVYSLNLGSTKTRVFAGFVLEYYGWSRKDIPYKDLQKISDKIPYECYILMVTGSYATGKETEESDIDVVVLVEDSSQPKKVYAELSQACELNIPPVHLYVFRHSEFKEMLSNKEVNYGKEIAKNCMILSGGQVYIKLMEEAIANGFDG